MDDDVLAGVVRAEKEIQERIEQERQSAAAWLDLERRRIEELADREEALIRAELGSIRTRAEQHAAEQAVLHEQQAADRTHRLEGLSDEALARIVARHIGIVLPPVTP